jgi:lipoyl(octanoyl) transferase
VNRRSLRAAWLGRRRYESIHLLQERLHEARKQGQVGDTLLLLEHEPVITLGRGAKADNVLFSPEALRERGFELVQTGRGGDVTYHGPGQLVGYPIVDLAPDRCDVRRYVGGLVGVMGKLAADFGVSAGTIEVCPGVWVDLSQPSCWPGEQNVRTPAKLGAVGVRISRWVTMHGFAFNATTDMDGYAVIVPCGIRERGVTSLRQLLGKAPEPEALVQRAAELVAFAIDAELVDVVDLRDPGVDLEARLLP